MQPTPNVLCPIDFSPLSQRSLRLAIEMCKRTGARLILEHNLESRPPNFLGVGWMWSEEHGSKERDKRALAVERLQRLFEEIPSGIEYEAKVTRGAVDEGVLYLARELPATMIVMGTHGPSDAVHSSLTERIILQAPCPVLTTGESYEPESVFGVEGGEPPENLTVLVPVDFKSRSLACARYALGLAGRMPHRFHLVHVATEREAKRPEQVAELDERLRELVPSELADRVTTRVMIGDAVTSILAVERELPALFVLIAAHGKSLLKRFLFGTTTVGVLHGSGCPVYFLPPKALPD